MAAKATNDLYAAALSAFKDELDGGFLYDFSGAVPAEASDALDVVTEHTELVKMSVGGDGTTGLTFNTPTGNMLSKTTAEVWKGVITFSGAESAETTLTPTFYRFCPAGDDGRGAASTPRIQGTVGGPSSGADLIRATDTMTDNGTNETGVSAFFVTLSSLG